MKNASRKSIDYSAATPLAETKPSISADKTLRKGLQILEALVQQAGPSGVTELAAMVDLTKSNTHRLLQTLVSAGYVLQDVNTRGYAASYRLWALGNSIDPLARLRAIARPYLEALAKKTDETVSLGAVEQRSVFVVDQIHCSHPIRAYFPVGKHVPVDQIVEGKGLLAFQKLVLAFESETYLADAMERIRTQVRGSRQYIPKLRAAVEAARIAGYATSVDEWQPGVSAVAAAVTRGPQELVGVVIFHAPSDRMRMPRLLQCAELVRTTARQISAALV